MDMILFLYSVSGDTSHFQSYFQMGKRKQIEKMRTDH